MAKAKVAPSAESAGVGPGVFGNDAGANEILIYRIGWGAPSLGTGEAAQRAVAVLIAVVLQLAAVLLAAERVQARLMEGKTSAEPSGLSTLPWLVQSPRLSPFTAGAT